MKPCQRKLKLTLVQRSSLVIIARARRERPGDEANIIIVRVCLECGIVEISA